jgi:diguanylate cyclase (GGDEF)-like protein
MSAEPELARPIDVLLVEDTPQDAWLIIEALHQSAATLPVSIEKASTLADAAAWLQKRSFDAVLLDLHLPDGRGVECVRYIKWLVPNQTIVVCTGLSDEESALLAMELGAQDYIVKADISGPLVARTLQRAIRRDSLLHASEAKLREQSLKDPLTGLPNRALFVDRAAMAIARAKREGSILGICWLDVDGLKAINDTHGHSAGDTALKTVAKALTRTVRGSDTIARFGGDEFAALLAPIGTTVDAGTIVGRMTSAVRRASQNDGHPSALSVSGGVSCFPRDGTDIDELLHRADMNMYAAKACRTAPASGVWSRLIGRLGRD